MSKNLVIVEDNSIRADLIAAITVRECDDGELKGGLFIHLIGIEAPLNWFFETYKDWLDNL